MWWGGLRKDPSPGCCLPGPRPPSLPEGPSWGTWGPRPQELPQAELWALLGHESRSGHDAVGPAGPQVEGVLAQLARLVGACWEAGFTWLPPGQPHCPACSPLWGQFPPVLAGITVPPLVWLGLGLPPPYPGTLLCTYCLFHQDYPDHKITQTTGLWGPLTGEETDAILSPLLPFL